MTVVDATVGDDLLHTTWGDGRTARFHHLWLPRQLRMRRVPAPPDLRADPRLARPARRHRSPPSAGLRRRPARRMARRSSVRLYRCLARGVRLRAGLPPAVAVAAHPLAAADLASPPEIRFDDVMAADARPPTCLRQLRRVRGVSFVRGAPLEPGTVTQVAERIAFLRNSNFGLLWDVRRNPSADSLAYTSHPLMPHTDLVSRTDQPGLQFLHCLVFDATGGDSVLVDGFACADRAASHRP